MKVWPFLRRPTHIQPLTVGPSLLDGHRGVWMWEFANQAEQSVTAVATTIARYAGADTLFIKAMSGQQWQSAFDTGKNAIGSLSVLNAAITEGQQAGITVIPWVEATGPGDAATHAQLGPTLIVDLEQPPNFWQADPGQILTYIQALKSGGIQNLFICLDPRPSAVAWAQVSSWQQFVTAFLPMTYWTQFQRPYTECVGYVQTLMAYGHPVYPVVEFDSSAADLTNFWQACNALGCTQGVSLWVLGSANGTQLTNFSNLAVKKPIPAFTNDDLAQLGHLLFKLDANGQPSPDFAGIVAYAGKFV